MNKGEFCVLLGPSGCGKTTTLRCVAGLERPETGRIGIGDRSVSDAEAGIFGPVEKRDIGMVFQSYAVWPHRKVFRNVAFPLTEGREVPLAIRPEHLEVLADTKDAAAGVNTVRGHLTGRWYLGDNVFCEVSVDEAVLVARVPADLKVGLGSRVRVHLPAEQLRVFADSPGGP